MSDIIIHYGIKGMKWGKRKRRSMSDDGKRHSELSKKKHYELSNAQLKEFNLRQENVNKFVKANPSLRKKALTGLSATAATLGTVTALYNFSTGPVAKKLQSAGKRAVDNFRPIDFSKMKLR